MPLSILDLTPPKTTAEKLLFPFQAVATSLFSSEPIDLLILEYGIRRKADAVELLRIAKPDWLIITDVQSDDQSLEHEKVLEGIGELQRALPRDRILWSFDDPLLAQSGWGLLPERALQESDCTIANNGGLQQQEGVSQLSEGSLAKAQSSLSVGQERLPFRRPIVGKSAGKALLAGVLLGRLLGLPDVVIQEFLNVQEP